MEKLSSQQPSAACPGMELSTVKLLIDLEVFRKCWWMDKREDSTTHEVPTNMVSRVLMSIKLQPSKVSKKLQYNVGTETF